MRKRRSTVFVKPGKDVTLYVPTDTPPAVIDYLNRLKAEGAFSQGVMEIVANYVLGLEEGDRERRSPWNSPQSTVEDSEDDVAFTAAVPFGLEKPAKDERPAEGFVAEGSGPDDGGESPGAAKPDPKPKLDMAELFRKAQHNAGKLAPDRPFDGGPRADTRP
ncbi:hypothetical protein [Paenibacillus flagellatus]|uniref:Uncharacterized protein n=1 Tax=Paenibacillus flagellatus TaxID=2211139 RepID=A0A2V5K060_9BACL|nr:hypothetical protein [Paenibacillus flagellatus]PYI52508.1 hypothetical protein DLM86_20240 [Paenibacillus flagellatus]